MAICRSCNKMLPSEHYLCRYCGEVTLVDTGNIASVSEQHTIMLDQVEALATPRIQIGPPWDEIWGGGFVPGSLTLLGGSAGMGKSTSSIQMASLFSKVLAKNAYYISAEQPSSEIKLTAERLEISNMNQFRVMKAFGAGADIDKELLKKDPPSCLFIDSVSALCGKDADAAVAVAKNMKKLAVEFQCAAFLVCHMNKQGDFGGLYTLQHQVDTIVTVMGPESERMELALLKLGHSEDEIKELRVICVWKNRNGPTNRDNFLTMTAHGLVALRHIEKKERKRKRSWLSEEVEAKKEIEAPQETEAPRRKTKKVPAPEAITVGGQRLVKKPRGPAEKAVEGEALKKRRAPMPKVGGK